MLKFYNVIDAKIVTRVRKEDNTQNTWAANAEQQFANLHLFLTPLCPASI